MASAVAMAAAHSVPPVYTVSLGPRIRPPRLLPGTKAENTNPQPVGRVPKGRVWAQGRWRVPTSSAVEHVQQTQSRQVEKALNQVTHGMNIYAYRHIRTNQVVYSLTRVMENSKILKQMVFHGKQTVPAALRRDLWRPYFSIRFNQTPAGAQAGLQAYRLLRELAAKRQLSPPEGFLIATHEDVELAKAKYDPANLADMEENKRPELRRLPRIGQMLPVKYRARKLMNQKQSSVADVAFVLKLINDAKLSPAELKEKCERRLVQAHEERSNRDKRRVNTIRAAEDKKELEIERRQQLVIPQHGQLRLDRYAAQRIAMEHGGAVASHDHITNLKDFVTIPSQGGIPDTSTMSDLATTTPAAFNEQQFSEQFIAKWKQDHGDGQGAPSAEEVRSATLEARRAHGEKFDQIKRESRNVEVVWSDLNDAHQAVSWSNNVSHAELDAKAVIKRQVSFIRQQAFVDSEGYQIDEQRVTRLVQASTSPHVIGRAEFEGWYQRPEDLAKLARDETAQRTKHWEETRREQIVRDIIAIRAQVADLTFRSNGTSTLPQYGAGLESGKMEVATTEQLEKTRSRLNEAQTQLRNIQDRYPAYAEILEELDQFSDLIAEAESLNKQASDLAEQSHSGPRTSQVIAAEQERDAERRKLLDRAEAINSEIRQEYDPIFKGFSSFERARLELNTELATREASKADLGRLRDARLSVRNLKVDIVLSAHQKRLKEEGDASYEFAGVTTGGPVEKGTDASASVTTPFTQSSADSSANEVVLDKGGVWSKLKGIFGR